MLDTIKILLILTSQSTMGPGGAPTGVWFEELATPYYAFADAGVQVDIASMEGGKIPIDPHSLKPEGKNPASVERFLKDKAAMAKITNAKAIKGLDTSGYAAVFLPGGHGTMWDMPNNAVLSGLLSKAWAGGKVIATVCHGPAGLVGVKDESGKPLVAGRRVSAFTDAEEKAAGLDRTVPFLLESRLRELGARIETGPNFQPFALHDGNLVTGQNPASSEAVARLTLEVIKQSGAAMKP